MGTCVDAFNNTFDYHSLICMSLWGAGVAFGTYLGSILIGWGPFAPPPSPRESFAELFLCFEVLVGICSRFKIQLFFVIIWVPIAFQIICF